jgi:predicted AAA+ superfamily ATPase
MIERLIRPPEQSFFLLGPRGSGKSTWLKAAFPDAHVMDLLSEATYQRLMVNPGSFADELRAVAPGKWVIVDEVQRLPGLLNEVHRFIEKSVCALSCAAQAPENSSGQASICSQAGHCAGPCTPLFRRNLESL